MGKERKMKELEKKLQIPGFKTDIKITTYFKKPYKKFVMDDGNEQATSIKAKITYTYEEDEDRFFVFDAEIASKYFFDPLLQKYNSDMYFRGHKTKILYLEDLIEDPLVEQKISTLILNEHRFHLFEFLKKTYAEDIFKFWETYGTKKER